MKTTALWMALALTAAALGALVAVSIQTVGAQAIAQPGSQQAGDFPVVGIVKGETARLHLVYLTEDPVAPPLNVAVQFLDSTGRPIKVEEHALQPNMVASTDLGPTEFDAAQLVEPGPRLEFRTSVQAEPPPCPPGTDGGSTGPPGTDGGVPFGGGSLIGSIEVFSHKGSATLITGPATAIPVTSACAPPGTDAGATP